jgi:hypothetical protein
MPPSGSKPTKIRLHGGCSSTLPGDLGQFDAAGGSKATKI